MAILEFFDKYFLIMMVYACFILRVVDSKSFKQKNDILGFKQAKIISNTLIIVSIILFLVARFI